MTIKKYLQTGQYCRLSHHNGRWMFWHSDGWHVVERKPYAKKTVELLITKNEHKAIAKLIEGDEEDFSQSST